MVAKGALSLCSGCGTERPIRDFPHSLQVFADPETDLAVTVVPGLAPTKMLLGFVAQSEAIGEEVVLQLTIGTRIRTAELKARSAGFQLSSRCSRVELVSTFGVGGL